jgi:hypothetical protein
MHKYSLGDSVYIVPDGSPEDYLKVEGSTGYRLSFWKSEAIDGYLVKNNVYMGYIGNEKDVIIPEGVTKLHNSDRFKFSVYNSINIPSTVTYIQKDNMFYNYIKTIYVSENTVIEEGAFNSKATIIRY